MSVWGASPTDVWAVSIDSTKSKSPNRLHWNGVNWSSVDITDELFVVAGLSSTDVWAFGYAGARQHWDGMTWTSLPPTMDNYYGILLLSSTDRWAIGAGGLVVRW
jgi:hypothetical protein